MNTINYVCFKLEEKATRSAKENNNSFINVLGDKFTQSIR